MISRSRSSCEQIDVRGAHEILRVDAELPQQIVRHRVAVCDRLIVPPHDLELHKRSQPVNLVEMDARLTDQIHRALFADDAAYAERSRENVEELRRRATQRLLYIGPASCATRGAAIT